MFQRGYYPLKKKYLKMIKLSNVRPEEFINSYFRQRRCVSCSSDTLFCFLSVQCTLLNWLFPSWLKFILKDVAPFWQNLARRCIVLLEVLPKSCNILQNKLPS